jgi:pentose-5-phosphate-3-epimerase
MTRNMTRKYECFLAKKVNYVDFVFEKTMPCDNIVHHVRHNNKLQIISLFLESKLKEIIYASSFLAYLLNIYNELMALSNGF